MNNLIREVNGVLDEVSKIDYKNSPHNVKFVHISTNGWFQYKEEIVREVLKRDDIVITPTGGHGGGMGQPNTHIFELRKRENLPAILDKDEQDKSISEILYGVK